jgi:serine/threonine protein kinase/tetratricopeptide (TPR) repeat protein
VLDARFRIEREAGSGAMGVVLRALDEHTGEPVAIKVLKGDRSASARFQREARVLSQLKHPAIVRYVAHGATASGAMYLAMEWLDGEDLSERLASGPLGLTDALHLAKRVADALAVAHARGIVHRDLKPSNLFLPGGVVRDVRLLDFGIARVQNATFGMTAAGVVIGTPGYMAPEQVRGDAVLDARADVFALGCVLFECLTGRAVFVGESIVALLAKILMEEPPRASELRAGLPPAIDELVAKMLAKVPSERFADGAAVRETITSVEGVADDRGSDAAIPVRRSAITRGEQHVVSVVIAGGRNAPAASKPPVGTESLSEEVVASLPISIDELASLDDAVKTKVETHGQALARTEAAENYVVPAIEALSRFGAHVDRLADGAIIATLHGAGAATDQAAQAARCALALRRLVPDVPVVLVTGRALFAGRIPMGPVIERAAKLLRTVGRSSSDEPPRIHLDDVTAGLLPSRFRVREGNAGHELTDEEEKADVPRTVLGRTTRFVGRVAEMGTLTGLYAQVESDGVSRAVIVTGAPGLGKSRLREELVAFLSARDPRPMIWTGSAEPLGAGTPLGMLRRVLRAALGAGDARTAGDDRTRIVERVRHRVPPPDAARVAAFLAELVGSPLDAAPAIAQADAQLQAARREPPLMAEQMQRAFVEFLRAECAAQPVVLLFEDAHWGDLPTVKLVDAALRELAESPLLVIAFARAEIEDAFPGMWSERSVLRLALGALTPRPAEQLARDILGANADAATVRRVVAQAAGNPFFLEELLRALVSGAPGTLPETLLAIVQKRIEALDEDARRVLRAASIYGGVFWRGAPAALLAGGADIDIDRRLADLVEREVIVRHAESRIAGEIEFAFRHALVRDAAYQMLTDADRALGHKFAGEWLESTGETNRALLAEHFERGGDRKRAARNYALAAAQAVHADDLDGCQRLAKRGLEVAEDEDDARGALHLARAEAHHWRAQFEDAHAEASEALHLLERGSDGWFAASAIAIAACATLHHATEADERAAELASTSAHERPAFLMAAAQCVPYLPHGEAGDALLARLPSDPTTISDPLLAARIHLARASRAQAKGDAIMLLEQISHAAEAFDRAGHRRGARAARANAGYASTELGRHEEAERILREALEDARRAGALGTVAWTVMHLGLALGRLGRTSEALALEREAAELARKQGNRSLEAEVAVTTADIYNASGAPDLAKREAEKARAGAVAPALRAAACSALATALVALGDAAGAHAAALEAMKTLQQSDGAEDAELVARLAFAEALDATGDRAAATNAIRAAKQALGARADAIADPAQRETFLRRVPVNARILQRVDAWLKSDV